MEKRRFSILEEDGVEFGIQREHETEAFDLQKEDTIDGGETLEVLANHCLTFKRRITVKGTLQVKGTLGII